jgi:hypothetical protein
MIAEETLWASEATGGGLRPATLGIYVRREIKFVATL